MNDDFTIQWHITERCNSACSHCYQTSKNLETSWSDMLAYIDQFRPFLAGKQGRIHVTGGEPLLHPDIWQLLIHLRQDFAVALLTNGTVIDEVAAQKLADLDLKYVQVSLDGGEAIHDSIRGPGNYQKVLQGTRYLVAAGVRVYVSFTAHCLNFQDLKSVAETARDMGVFKVRAERMVPIGNGSNLHILQPAEVKKMMELMNTLPISMERSLQFLYGGTPYRCKAGRSLIAVLPDGAVVPCRRLPIVSGNLKEESLLAIYNSALFNRLREDVCTGCQDCPHLEVCNGGLRCQAYAVTGDPFQPDPGCWLQNHTYNKAKTNR